MATVSVSPKTLPDASMSLSEGGVYTYSVTGISDLAETPRLLTLEETRAGIVSASPPTVAAADKRDLDLLMVRAIEIAGGSALEALLKDPAPNGTDQPLKHQLFISQICRLTRICLQALEGSSA